MHKPPSLARAITFFSPQDRKKLLHQARTIFKHAGLEIRMKSTQHPFGRILIITPKKMGAAPQRNLIKRRLKALFYEEKFYQKGFNLVIFCRKGSASIPFTEIKHILNEAYDTAEKAHDTIHH